MTPLLILTHGDFGPVLLRSTELMYGRQESVLALGLAPDETREDFAARVRLALAELKARPLVLVDLACGTPWNVALLEGCAASGGEVLAGLSMPLLLEAMGLRATHGPVALAADLARLAPQALVRSSELLPGAGGCA